MVDGKDREKDIVIFVEIVHRIVSQPNTIYCIDRVVNLYNPMLMVMLMVEHE